MVIGGTVLGGSAGDYGDGVAVDSSGDAWLIGYARSTNFPLVSREQGGKHGRYDVFMTQLNAAESVPSSIHMAATHAILSAYGRNHAASMA
jgi:hypothetical protein